MIVVKLSPEEVRDLAAALQRSEIEVLVAVDTDGRSPQLGDRVCLKVKIDGGVWSPPMGRRYR